MRFRVTLVFLLCQVVGLQAQQWYGMNQSNYNGANAFYFNTAMSVSSPYMVSSNGFATGMHLDNNYLTYKIPFSMTQWVTGNVPEKNKNANGKINYSSDWFEENLDGSPKNFDLNIETRGPGAMYNFNRKFSVGFFTRTRIGLQGFGINEDLARILRHGIDSSDNVIYDPPNQIEIGKEYGDNAFSVNLNSFSEIGVGVAYALIKNHYLTFSVGANFKYLMGKGTGYVKNNGTSFKVNGYDSIVFGETDFEYGYVEPNHFSSLNTFNFLNGQNQATGFGIDLSAYIELKRPKGKIGSRVKIEDVEYFFRGGIAIMDMGGVTYKDNVNARKITNTSSKTWVPGEEFATAWAGGFETGLLYMDSTINSLFTVTEVNEIRSNLPTTLNLHGDLKIISKFYIGAQIFQSLRSKKSANFRRPSSAMIMPRFESKGFELGVPISVYNDYQNATLGLFVRLGPFFFGTDNLLSSINNSAFKGFNYYMGVAYGFGNSSQKEKY